MDVITMTSPAADDPQAEPDAPAAAPETLETMEQLTARQSRERAALDNRLRREQREATAATLAGLRNDAASALATVIDELRQRLRADRARGELFVVPMYGRPREAADLERIAAEAAPGERPALIFVPRPDAYGDQERKAWAFVDVSDVVWGGR